MESGKGQRGPRVRSSSRGELAGKPPYRNPRDRPALRIMTTTLWEYPSQHYTSESGKIMQGDKDYVGATPSWVIWQLLQRYTREELKATIQRMLE